LLPGYGWYFPVADDVANVGVGMLMNPMARRGLSLDRLFREFIATNKHVGERLDGARLIGQLRGAPIPMGPGPSHTIFPGCLFVGDAAGFVDALTGEGIGAAMHSGRMAADVAADTLGTEKRDPRRLEVYRARCRARFGSSMRASYWLQRMLGTGFFVERLVRGAARRPALSAQLFEMVAGVLPKTAAFHPANVARALL
jgi:flavin-dependent dehydrogenase